MRVTDNLIPGTLIKRYKRFFADVRVNNQVVTAHCPNSGSMLGLLDKNNKVWISKSKNPNAWPPYLLLGVHSFICFGSRDVWAPITAAQQRRVDC